METTISQAPRKVAGRDRDLKTSAEYCPAPVKRGSIIHEAAEEICRLIKGKRLRSGDALPPETTLSEMLGLSRNSVREAIRMLHGLGVVDKAAGRSAVVTAASTSGWGLMDETMLVEAAEVANSVRILTMEKCVALAAQRLSEEDLVQLKQDFDVLEAAAARRDSVAAKLAHDAFYGLILSGARNPLLASIFKQADSARLTALCTPTEKTFVNEHHLEHHRALLDALLKRDSDAAARAARKHYAALGRMIKLVSAQGSQQQSPGVASVRRGVKSRNAR